MSELTSGDLWQFGYWLIGLISLFIMILTGDLFWLFYVVLFSVLFVIHSWMSVKSMEMNFFFNRKKAEILEKREMLKFEAMIDELREIKQALKKVKK